QSNSNFHYQSENEQELVVKASSKFEKLRNFVSRVITNPVKPITPKVKRYVKKPKVITYVPGQLPTVEEWEKLGKPKVQFANASERKQLLQEAVNKGYKHILDNSHPGLGKSYNAGELKPGDFQGVDVLIYQDVNHRNPSTATVEDNFVDIPTRNNGYKIDYTRSTPSGQPYLVRTKPGELPDTPSNCHRTYMFDALRNKNYSDVFGAEESSISPICESCVFSEQCAYSSGNGYGFRYQKRNAIESSDNLRAHPDTAPLIINDENNGPPRKIGRSWEEAGVAINSSKKIEVSIDDLYATFGKLAVGDYPKNALLILKPLFEILERLLNKQIKLTNRYGFDDSDIKKLIRDNYELSINNSLDNSDIESFADKALYELATYGLEELEQSLLPDLSFLQEKDGIDATSEEFKESKALRYANKQVANQSARDAGQKALALPLNWLPEFIKAWVGNGAFRCEHGKLSIYTRDLRHKELADNAEFNLYLDATLSPELLRLKLGIQEPVLVIEQVPPSYSNLNIVQITGFGKPGKQRSNGLINRVDASKSALREKHSNLGILEWKSNAGDNEYYHFSDGRGVNRFINCDALASFGIPYANVGELAAEYQVLTGNEVDSEATQQFINEITDSEIVQEIGRLRSNRRPDEELTFYFCADYDLSFLGDYFPGATLTKVDAFAITHKAGTQSQQTKLAILEAAKELTTRGNKLTQNAIANLAEITQGTVSKIASQFGGWSSLKKIFQTLLDSLYSERNIFDGEGLTDEEKDYIPGLSEYLPSLAAPEVSVLEAVGALVEVLEVMGEKVFKTILANLDVTTRCKLLGKILPLDCVEAQIILDLTPT
ncbi:MAG: DNA primase, partial [Cyanobacteria bacterium J06636_27]